MTVYLHTRSWPRNATCPNGILSRWIPPVSYTHLTLDMAQLQEIWEQKLEPVYPYRKSGPAVEKLSTTIACLLYTSPLNTVAQRAIFGNSGHRGSPPQKRSVLENVL